MSTAIKQLPSGAYPTMITPFLDDEQKSVDWDTLDSKTYVLSTEHGHAHLASSTYVRTYVCMCIHMVCNAASL